MTSTRQSPVAAGTVASTSNEHRHRLGQKGSGCRGGAPALPVYGSGDTGGRWNRLTRDGITAGSGAEEAPATLLVWL